VWGWKQVNIGLDPFEQGWLEAGGKITHVLAGQLRAFSFFSDAGQFGVVMAYVAYISLILSFGPYKLSHKFLWVAFLFVLLEWVLLVVGPFFIIFFGAIYLLN
jgi:hypothetical protein